MRMRLLKFTQQFADCCAALAFQACQHGFVDHRDARQFIYCIDGLGQTVDDGGEQQSVLGQITM